MNELLFEIANRYGAKYAPRHSPDNFLFHYAKILPVVRDGVRSVFEIGVGDGTSLKLWKEYFPSTKVVGLDIRDCRSLGELGIDVFMGSQSDEKVLKGIINAYSPFDMIIDDGSREYGDQLFTFQRLFPYVVSGGIYIIEGGKTSFSEGMCTKDSLFNSIKSWAIGANQSRVNDISAVYTALNFTVFWRR